MAPFRNKPFTHFDDLCYVWGKDRATGKDAQSAHDINEENQRNNVEVGLDKIKDTKVAEEADVSIAFFDPSINSPKSVSKKRKRRNGDSEGNDTVVEALTNVSRNIESSIHALCNTVEKLAYEADMKAMREQIFNQLINVHGLTRREIVHAHVKLSQDEKLMVAFCSIPDEMKVEWIREIIE